MRQIAAVKACRSPRSQRSCFEAQALAQRHFAMTPCSRSSFWEGRLSARPLGGRGAGSSLVQGVCQVVQDGPRLCWHFLPQRD